MQQISTTVIAELNDSNIARNENKIQYMIKSHMQVDNFTMLFPVRPNL